MHNDKTKAFISYEGKKPYQKRLVNSLCKTTEDLLKAHSEGDFFQASSELMELVAQLIQQCDYAEGPRTNDSIPLGKQALEYSLDNIFTSLQEGNSLKRYDN